MDGIIIATVSIIFIAVILFIPLPVKFFARISTEDPVLKTKLRLFGIIKIRPHRKKNTGKIGNMISIVKVIDIKKISLNIKADINEWIWSPPAAQSIAVLMHSAGRIIAGSRAVINSSVIPVVGNGSEIQIYISVTFTIFKLLKELLNGKNVSNS